MLNNLADWLPLGAPSALTRMLRLGFGVKPVQEVQNADSSHGAVTCKGARPRLSPTKFPPASVTGRRSPVAGK